MKISIALKLNDGGDGSLKATEGDIVAVCPSGWQWGTKEIEQYLIIELNLGTYVTALSHAKKFMSRNWNNAKFSPDTDADGSIISTAIHKCRFNISFDDLDIVAQSLGITIDWKRVRDIEDNYQPFEGYTVPTSALLNLVKDKRLGRKIQLSDITNMINSN